MIPALLLVLSVVVCRVTTGLLIHSGAGWLSNFAPLAAIALCSAAYFPNKYKFSVPLLTLFISDVIINLRYGAPLLDPQILVRYAALALVGWLGLLLQSRASLKTLLPASIVASTIGLPQFSATPSWMFFRNSLVSDLIFTGLFVVCMNAGRSMGRSRERGSQFRPVAAG
jgi:hypothetical protein